MSDIIQKTLYLTTLGTEVSKSQQTLKITNDKKSHKIPIRQISSVCIFGPIRISPNALSLCLSHQVSVHFHTINGYLLGQLFGSGDTRYLIRVAQYEKSHDPKEARDIASMFVAGKIQNSRINLLRSRRESTSDQEIKELTKAINLLAKFITQLQEKTESSVPNTVREALDPIRGVEGMAARVYFDAFNYMIKQQRDDFSFKNRTRRPPLDRINCLLSFLYALTRSDCLTAISVAGLDPYMAWLHTTRAGRPACALDLMEEFRPHAERVALTLINRNQIHPEHFKELEGGAFELTDAGRKAIITGWKKRKEIKLKHELFKSEVFMGQVFSIQAKLLARWLRGDTPYYVPFISN